MTGKPKEFAEDDAAKAAILNKGLWDLVAAHAKELADHRDERIASCYAVIGLFWQNHRNDAGLSRQTLVQRMVAGLIHGGITDITEMALQAFEEGMSTAHQIRAFSPAYAAALGKPELYATFLDYAKTQKIPEWLYLKEPGK